MNQDNKKQDKKVDEVENVDDVEIEEENSSEPSTGRYPAEKNTEVEKLKQKVADFENNYKRALADYQNLEKRTREDRRNWIALANKELILRLLPVLDTLMMAAKHTDNQGLTLSIQLFLQALKDEGVEQIVTKGKQFDPHQMEVIDTVAGEDEGKVVEEVRAGFILGGKVIRPAHVNVGQGK